MALAGPLGERGIYAFALTSARPPGSHAQQHASALHLGNLDEALDRLVAGLMKFTGHHVTDDPALVIAENRWS